MALLSVSLLGGDFLNIEDSISLIEAAKADCIHIDIMDGHYVEDFGFSARWIEAVRKKTNIPIDVHFIVEKPEKIIESFVNKNISSMVFHTECCEKVVETIDLIKSYGIKAGIAISPDIKVRDVIQWFRICDEVMIMTVKPGCAGSAVCGKCIEKILKIKKIIMNLERDVIISVDGGIRIFEAKRCADEGADKIIVGTSFFNSVDPIKFCNQVHQLK